jgi:hypothetical protein
MSMAVFGRRAAGALSGQWAAPDNLIVVGVADAADDGGAQVMVSDRSYRNTFSGFFPVDKIDPALADKTA